MNQQWSTLSACLNSDFVAILWILHSSWVRLHFYAFMYLFYLITSLYLSTYSVISMWLDQNSIPKPNIRTHFGLGWDLLLWLTFSQKFHHEYKLSSEVQFRHSNQDHNPFYLLSSFKSLYHSRFNILASPTDLLRNQLP